MAGYEVEAVAEALRGTPLALAPAEIAEVAEKLVDELHRQDLRLTAIGGLSCDD